ncbi:hypothetical protein C8R46DRAFT_1233646 [Mycena filopes]|nr:hypothetical protein C8R46DRAFT_1233646 [Mycena filopes]
MATQSIGQHRPRSSSAASDDHGDCVLKVAGYLCKVHRYHLLRGADSVFKDMFAFPSGAVEAQGHSDSNPIILSGDTTERFRAFLKIAYAEPLEFQEAETQLDQLPTFIDCAHFAHKYEVTPLFRAAISVILNLLKPQPALTMELSISALELSSLCDDMEIPPDALNCKRRIRHAVQMAWLRQFPAAPTFECRKNPIYLISADRTGGSVEIMDISAQYELNELAAVAASEYHSKMSDHTEPTAIGTFPPLIGHTWLKNEHRMRILAGAWSMEQAWRRAIAKAPALPARGCGEGTHSRACVPIWQTIWKRSVESPELHLQRRS